MHNVVTESAAKAFLRLAFKMNPKVIQWFKIVTIISLVSNLLMYRSCLCFYNDEIGFYSHKLGYGINTYATRLLQVQKACPPGPPCQVYTTVPENP